MQIKTTLRYHFSAIKLAKIQKFENAHTAGKAMGKQAVSYSAGGSVN